MARLVHKPVNPERFPRMADLQMQKFAEGRVNAGMITTIDPADIPPGAMQLIKNATVRHDVTARRAGSVFTRQGDPAPILPTKPDSNPVLKVAHFKKADGSPYTLRFTPFGIYQLSGSSWTPLVGTLDGETRDRIQTTVVLDQLVFSNNGANNIQLFDTATASFGNLGNAPKYRYVTGAFNRVVGAARRNEAEHEIGWSGENNIEEWDQAVDHTAGSTPLVDSPADLSDFITGVFSYSNILVILRERSVWVANKQPIPQNPFYFAAAVPNIGCDSPFSATLIGNGLAWLDRRSATVYAYQPGSQPEPIGRPIEKSIIANIDDPELIFSSYDPVHNEYSIAIPQVGSADVDVWTYNLRGKAWARNTYYKITSMDDTDIAAAGTTIDELGDTLIDNLVGDINSLSPIADIVSTRNIGRDDGTIGIIDENAALDAPHTDFPLGIPYQTQLVSKAFTVPESDIYIAQINIEYLSRTGGAFTLEYSLTGGALDDWKVAKTVNPSVIGKPKLLILRKVIKSRRFAFRLTTDAGLFEVLSYEVHVYPSGRSTK